MADEGMSIVELNVGGVFYTTSMATLMKEPDSLLAQMFSQKSKSQLVKDNKGRVFLDRDGVLFRYVLDYLRNQALILPENFHEKERLKQEAEYFKLTNMVKSVTAAVIASTRKLPPISSANSTGNDACTSRGYIILGYRGTFAFGRDGLADVKFRKLSRLLVSGRVCLCREVFGDTLNESRDPDRGTSDRYTARFFLKHSFIEQAFDMLQEANFKLAGCCGSGTNSAGEVKPGMDSEESKWNHYNEFIFVRD